MISANKPDRAYIKVEVVDTVGNVIPYANDLEIHFQVSGEGILVAVGNPNFKNVVSFQQPIVKVFHGKALAIIKSKWKEGKVALKATFEGLCSDEVKVSMTRSK